MSSVSLLVESLFKKFQKVDSNINYRDFASGSHMLHALEPASIKKYQYSSGSEEDKGIMIRISTISLKK